jgi:hypothetical protein
MAPVSLEGLTVRDEGGRVSREAHALRTFTVLRTPRADADTAMLSSLAFHED